ncbi:MAG TPA: response regulator, partial [Terriglobia bacterium]|nr:response regulator [Terriglobia bacterium]
LESNTKLHEANQHLEAATRVKSEFLANMSHEIRTPLAGVIGMTTLLGDTPLSNEQLSYVETIRNSGSALLELINDVLDFSKIEAGKLEFEEQPFELGTCVEETLELLSMKASEKNLALGYIIEPSVRTKLLGDVGRIRQILINLIGNAVKFTARGEISVRIFRPNDDQTIQVSIRDTGIGIPRDLQDRLFQSFSQIQRSSSRSFGGTGLGLAISKQLTEKMGGRIWVESEADRGSTFHFTMNLKPQSNPSGDQTPSVPNFAGKRVLILEDQPMHREILVRRIQALGMPPSQAGTAEEALRVIQQGPAFDAVILNSRLRDIAPMELAKRIRATPAGAFVRLILMSPQHKRLHAQARQAGINSFLNEPVREGQLREAFNSVCDTENAFGTTHKISEIDRDLGTRYPLRILVADDNTVNQKVVLGFLLKLGYRAEVVSSGVEVIWSLERQSYDLVFMDIQMPEMNGDEASRRIRQKWSDEERPLIVAMTANAMQGDREKCLEAGMDDYVTKPVSIRDLQSTLERWGKYIHNQKNTRRSLPDSGTGG